MYAILFALQSRDAFFEQAKKSLEIFLHQECKLIVPYFYGRQENVKCSVPKGMESRPGRKAVPLVLPL